MRYNGARHKTEIVATKSKKSTPWTFAIHLPQSWKLRKQNSTKTVSDTGNWTSLITIWRSKKNIAPIMRFTVWRGQRNYQRSTRNYPLTWRGIWSTEYGRDCVQYSEKMWRDWRIFASICSDTLIKAICFQTVQHLKICKNFSDTLISSSQWTFTLTLQGKWSVLAQDCWIRWSAEK